MNKSKFPFLVGINSKLPKEKNSQPYINRTNIKKKKP